MLCVIELIVLVRKIFEFEFLVKYGVWWWYAAILILGKIQK